MQPPITPQDRIVLVGGSVRAAAQSAAEGGLRVFGIDRFGDVDARAACERFLVFGAADDASGLTLPSAIGRSRQAWPGATLVVSGGLSDIDRCSAEIDGEAFAGGKDPRRLTNWADGTGVTVPETLPRPPAGHAAATAGRWLIKPVHGTGGLGIRWADTPAPDPTVPSHWQAFTPGRPLGVTCLATTDGVRILGVCRSIVTRKFGSPFVYAGSVGPVSLEVASIESIRRLATRFAQDVRHQGLFNIDLIRSRDGKRLTLLEINPRWSASMEVIEGAARAVAPEASRPSLMRQHVDAVRGHASQPVRFDPVPTPSTRVLYKRIVYADRCGVFDADNLPQAGVSIDHSGRVRSPTWRWADVPTTGTPVLRHQPLVTLIMTCGGSAVGASDAKLLRRLVRHACRSIRPA